MAIGHQFPSPLLSTTPAHVKINVLDPDSYCIRILTGSDADPDPGSGAFLTPGFGMGRKSASGSGIRFEQPGSYFLELRNHFFGFFETVRIRGGKKSDPGSGINIADPQHC
jgi:hypothetical protein